MRLGFILSHRVQCSSYCTLADSMRVGAMQIERMLGVGMDEVRVPGL